MQEVKNKRLSLGDLLILIIIAALTFMIIPAWVPFLRKGWVLLIVAMLIILLNCRNCISARAVIVLLGYEIIVFLNALLGDAYFDTWTSAIYEFLILFVPLSLALYCTKGGNERFVRSLVYITFIGLVFELIASFLVLKTNPGMIRGLYLMSKEEGGVNFMYRFYKLGLMDYSMGHAIPLLIGPLVYYFKEGSRKEKWICLLLIIACIFLVWLAESATALLLMILIIFTSFMIDKKASLKKNVFIILLMVLVAVVLMSNDSIIGGIFDVSGRLVKNDAIYAARIEDLRMSLMEDKISGDVKGRMNLYGQSIDMFSGYGIILGSNQMPGRHSGFLDRFASLGLIGFIPLFFFFFFSLKTIWISLPKSRRIYYLESIVAALLMLSFKAMWLWPVFLFLYVIAPCILIMNKKG